jgi:hypothetical protein
MYVKKWKLRNNFRHIKSKGLRIQILPFFACALTQYVYMPLMAAPPRANCGQKWAENRWLTKPVPSWAPLEVILVWRKERLWNNNDDGNYFPMIISLTNENKIERCRTSQIWTLFFIKVTTDISVVLDTQF